MSHELAIDILLGEAPNETRNSINVLIEDEPLKPEITSNLIKCYTCHKCHYVIERNYNFCYNCGKRIDWNEVK